MAIVYIASLGEGEGKTALSLGLARRWLAQGVAYVRVEGKEEDAQFATRVLNQQALTTSLSQLPQALAKSQGTRIAIVEGASPQDWTAVKGLGAKALLLAFYPRHPREEVIATAQNYGADLLGVVVNAFPRSLDGSNGWRQGLAQKGLALLGMVPEDRTLLAPSVRELAHHLGGNILNHQGAAEELVEEILVGVYSLDPAPLYYERKTKKAAVIRGDRPDMQLGALETPTRCLILTGDVTPNHYVRQQAELNGVPIVVVKQDTASTLEAIEKFLPQVRFRQDKKLGRLEELLQQHLDWEGLGQRLGLA